MVDSLRNISTRRTSQREPAAGMDQIANSEGGYVFSVSPFERLRRFLILGSDGGSYYANERTLTAENYTALQECVKTDAIQTVDIIVEISDGGRAPKNDYAIFALAYVAAHGPTSIDRNYALINLPKVARIGTHLFQFVEFVQNFRGWGRSLRRGIENWYNGQDVNRLAYQVTKYGQRNGWSHRDLLRLSHAKTDDPVRNAIYKYIVSGEVEPIAPNIIGATKFARRTEDPREAVELIKEHGLTREMLNPAVLKDVGVWEALLRNMPMTAMIRNLGVMTANGTLKDFNNNVATVTNQLTDMERLRKARVHPLTLLNAMRTYQNGAGIRGALTWNPVTAVEEALEEAFELSFGVIEPANARTLIGVDVSGSMRAPLSALPFVSCSQAAAVLALITAKHEPAYAIYGFDHGMKKLNITARSSVGDAMRATEPFNYGGTDCSLPMILAKEGGIDVDTFIVYTDSETWRGTIHPFQALREYRQAQGINAKLIVVGMVSNGFTIADPDDEGMLDVVGFDTATPNIISAFSRGDF